MPIPAGTYDYYLAPYVWDPETGWNLPPQARFGLDLRPRAARIQAGGTPQGFALFAIPAGGPAPLNGFLLNNDLESRLSRAKHRGFESRLGLGDGDLDLPDFKRSIFTLLSDHADPKGETGPKPLMPMRNGRIRLLFPGHRGLSYEEKLDPARHTKVRDTAIEDMKQLRAEGAFSSPEHEAAVRSAMARQNRVKESDLRAAPSGGAVSVSDNFNRADESPLASPWEMVDGDYDLSSNEAVGSSGGSTWPRSIRHGTALDSPHMYVEVEKIDTSGATIEGPAVRFDGSAESCYWLLDQSNGTNFHLNKVESGTNTSITSDINVGTNTHVDRLVIDGSILLAYQDGTFRESTTDTSLTTGLHGGVASHTSNNGTIDNYVSSVLTTARRFGTWAKPEHSTVTFEALDPKWTKDMVFCAPFTEKRFYPGVAIGANATENTEVASPRSIANRTPGYYVLQSTANRTFDFAYGGGGYNSPNLLGFGTDTITGSATSEYFRWRMTDDPGAGQYKGNEILNVQDDKLTCMAVFRSAGDASGDKCAMLWRRNTDDDAYELVWDTDGLAEFTVDTGSAVTVTADTNTADDLWHVYVGRYDGANISLWIDGVKEAEAAQTGDMGDLEELNLLGGNKNPSGLYTSGGWLAIAAIWRYGMSDNMIKELSINPFAPITQRHLRVVAAPAAGAGPPKGSLALMGVGI